MARSYILQRRQAHVHRAVHYLPSATTANMPFENIPSNASLKFETFNAHVSDFELDDFKTLLKPSKIGPKT